MIYNCHQLQIGWFEELQVYPVGTVPVYRPYLPMPMASSANGEDPTVTDYFMTRMGRRLFKFFPEFFLKTYNPLPAKLTKRLQRWAKPHADRVYKECVFYDDIVRELQARKTPHFSVVKTVLNPKIYSFYNYIHKGRTLRLFSKWLIGIFTVVSVYKNTKDTYEKTANINSAEISALHQSIRWVLGGEIGALFYDVGLTLSKQHRWLSGLITAALGSALFDYYWNKPKSTIVSRLSGRSWSAWG